MPAKVAGFVFVSTPAAFSSCSIIHSNSSSLGSAATTPAGHMLAWAAAAGATAYLAAALQVLLLRLSGVSVSANTLLISICTRQLKKLSLLQSAAAAGEAAAGAADGPGRAGSQSENCL
jgi:hypothetical protein